MIVQTKKYRGDISRAYRALMKKLNKEGFYQEFKEKQYFKSKSQKKREQLAKSVSKEKKRQKKQEEKLVKLENRPPKKNKR